MIEPRFVDTRKHARAVRFMTSAVPRTARAAERGEREVDVRLDLTQQLLRGQRRTHFERDITHARSLGCRGK
jgi:hypothetical protein